MGVIDNHGPSAHSYKEIEMSEEKKPEAPATDLETDELNEENLDDVAGGLIGCGNGNCGCGSELM